MLQEETLRPLEEYGRKYEEPDGDFLEVIEKGSNTITVLTRVDSEKGDEVDLPFQPSGLKVKTLKKRLEETDLSDEQIIELLDAETDAKSRKTAIAAIKNQA